MKTLIGFLCAGGIAALLNWLSRFVFSLWFNFEVAIVLAYIVGMISGFILMRLFVFHAPTKAAGPQIAKFLLVNGLAVLQTIAVSVLFARWVLPQLGITSDVEGLAHLVGVCTPVATSFFLHKHFTFR